MSQISWHKRVTSWVVICVRDTRVQEPLVHVLLQHSWSTGTTGPTMGLSWEFTIHTTGLALTRIGREHQSGFQKQKKIIEWKRRAKREKETDLHALGTEGVLPGGYIESFLRVFKQFTHFTQGQMVGKFSMYSPLWSSWGQWVSVSKFKRANEVTLWKKPVGSFIMWSKCVPLCLSHSIESSFKEYPEIWSSHAQPYTQWVLWEFVVKLNQIESFFWILLNEPPG